MTTTDTTTRTYVERVGTHRAPTYRAAPEYGTAYVVVRLELRTMAGTRPTVDHGTVTDALEVSLTGEHYAPYDRKDDPSSAGQCRDALLEVTDPAPGWTLDEVRELATLWDRWHLNGMRAACSHMPNLEREPDGYGGTRVACGALNTCEVGSGYTYGASWLTEPVPGDVVARLEHLMRDRSDDLYTARGYDMFGRVYPAVGAR